MTQELLDSQRTPDFLKPDTDSCTNTAMITAKDMRTETGTDTVNGPGEAYREFKGVIIHSNIFGATIDVLVDDILAAGYEIGDVLSVAFANGFRFDAALVTNFSEVAQGYFVQARRGKHPTFGIKYGDLAKTASLAVGDGITFGMKTKAGFLAALQSRQLVRTDTRADYSSDAAFANFREIATTGVGRGKLFRGGHPIRPDLSRAPYAAALMQAAGVNTVVNMCDTEAGLASLLDKSSNPHASGFYQSLVDKGSVITLNLGLNFADACFAGPLASLLRFMTTHAAPYYLHCKSGKDRTGYVCALLEALAGATQAEIVEDYMASYVSHFGVEPGTARYDALAEENVVTMLQHIVGADKQLDGVDLALAAKTYLGKCGMSVTEITALCSCIGDDSMLKK